MMEYTHYCDEDILVGSPSVLQSAVELFALRTRGRQPSLSITAPGRCNVTLSGTCRVSTGGGRQAAFVRPVASRAPQLRRRPANHVREMLMAPRRAAGFVDGGSNPSRTAVQSAGTESRVGEVFSSKS